MPNNKTAEEAAKEAADIHCTFSEEDADEYRDGFTSGYIEASTTTAAEIERLREYIESVNKAARELDDFITVHSVQIAGRDKYWEFLKLQTTLNKLVNNFISPPQAQKDDDGKC